MEQLLDQYRERFGEPLPLYEVFGMSDEEIDEIVRECLAKNKPFKAKEVGKR